MKYIPIDSFNLNTENLLAFAKALKHVHDHPENYQHHFDMEYYRADNIGCVRISKSNMICGTVACAIGFGPMLPSFGAIESDFEDDTFVTFKYTERLFNMPIEGSYVNDYLFASYWKDADNTALGVALRIEEICSKGLPDNWFEQVRGKAQLSYLENV